MRRPKHPEQIDAPTQRDPGSDVRWPAVVAIGVVGALVVVIVILHLIGAVGPGAH